MNSLNNVLVLVALLTAASSSAGAAQDARPHQALCPNCNIVLVSFDALQAAHVHSLGYPRDVTPTIDRFAQRGVSFGQAISPAPWTVPATMAWFTGASPASHHIVNKYVEDSRGQASVANLQRLSPDLRTLPQVLKSAGYTTGGFTGDAGVNGMFGFSGGFDVYSDSVPAFSGFHRSAPQAIAWVKKVRNGKFFLFLHGYDVHGQYKPRDGFDRRYVNSDYRGPYDGGPDQQRGLRERGLAGHIDVSSGDVEFWRAIYDEKIARADAEFAAFASSMTALGVSTNTVWVLASDHGTEFFEHNKLDHGATLYDELTHVLLVVVAPNVKTNVIVSQQVSTLNLMPTLLDIVDVPADAALKRQMEGHSLVPLLRGESLPAEDIYIETDYRLYTHKRGLRTADGWKLIHTLQTKTNELYNLNTDPGEARDQARNEPRLAYELEQKLFAHYKKLGVDLDEQEWPLGCSPVYADQCR
jgi:arylsulfatase A-like enzyme